MARKKWTTFEDKILLENYKLIGAPRTLRRFFPDRTLPSLQARYLKLTKDTRVKQQYIQWTHKKLADLKKDIVTLPTAQVLYKWNLPYSVLLNTVKRHFKTNITTLRFLATGTIPASIKDIDPRNLGKSYQQSGVIRHYYQQVAPESTLCSLPKATLAKIIIDMRSQPNE